MQHCQTDMNCHFTGHIMTTAMPNFRSIHCAADKFCVGQPNLYNLLASQTFFDINSTHAEMKVITFKLQQAMIIFTVRCYAQHRLCHHPSVTSWYSVETAKHIIKLFHHWVATTYSSFAYQTVF